MSCGSHLGTCGGCGCQQPCSCNYRVIVNNNGGSAGVTGAVNANTTGVGVFDALDNGVLYFRGIESADASYLSVSLNATNHTVLLTFNVNALTAALPQATTTQAGVGETATNAEAQGKAATDKFLTPSNLAALDATDSFSGLIEIATQAEVNTGASSTLAITPATMSNYIVTQTNQVPAWVDSISRAALAPTRAGQLGTETGSGTSWTAYGTSAGNWNQNLVLGVGLATTHQQSADTSVSLDAGTAFSFDGIGQLNINCDFQFFGNVNYDGGSRFSINNGQIPANSVFITSSTAGQPSSALISTFVSSANTQTGYTAFSNPATLRTCDTATVTLPQLAQIVGTLIEDLKAVKLPAT